MDYNYTKLFNLEKNYTINDLKKSFSDKIKIINSMDISYTDKQILFDNYKREYNNAKINLETPTIFNENYLLDHTTQNINNLFGSMMNLSNFGNNMDKNGVYSKSYSFSKVTNNNGISTVLENKQINNNGKIDNNTYSYKIINGEVIPIEYNEALINFNENKYLTNSKNS